MTQITLDRELVRRISKITNRLYGDLEQGIKPALDLEEIQEIDERLQNELCKSI